MKGGKPILFSGEMVNAILEGRKSLTRRVMKPQPDSEGGIDGCNTVYDHNIAELCPYGQVGDRLWCKEGIELYLTGTPIRYKADGCPVMKVGESAEESDWVWKRPSLNSMFMPRWASRITLEITGVKVERLNQISFADCLAEGIVGADEWDVPDYKPPEPLNPDDLSNEEADKEIDRGWVAYATQAYAHLWDKINGKRYPWESNPFVWCISFKKLPTNPVSGRE